MKLGTFASGSTGAVESEPQLATTAASAIEAATMHVRFELRRAALGVERLEADREVMRDSKGECRAAGSQKSPMRSSSSCPCTNSKDGTDPAMRPRASKCTVLLASPSNTHGDWRINEVRASDCPHRWRDPLAPCLMKTIAP